MDSFSSSFFDEIKQANFIPQFNPIQSDLFEPNRFDYLGINNKNNSNRRNDIQKPLEELFKEPINDEQEDIYDSSVLDLDGEGLKIKEWNQVGEVDNYFNISLSEGIAQDQEEDSNPDESDLSFVNNCAELNNNLGIKMPDFEAEPVYQDYDAKEPEKYRRGNGSQRISYIQTSFTHSTSCTNKNKSRDLLHASVCKSATKANKKKIHTSMINTNTPNFKAPQTNNTFSIEVLESPIQSRYDREPCTEIFNPKMTNNNNNKILEDHPTTYDIKPLSAFPEIFEKKIDIDQIFGDLALSRSMSTITTSSHPNIMTPLNMMSGPTSVHSMQFDNHYNYSYSASPFVISEQDEVLSDYSLYTNKTDGKGSNKRKSMHCNTVNKDEYIRPLKNCSKLIMTRIRQLLRTHEKTKISWIEHSVCGDYMLLNKFTEFVEGSSRCVSWQELRKYADQKLVIEDYGMVQRIFKLLEMMISVLLFDEQVREEWLNGSNKMKDDKKNYFRDEKLMMKLVKEFRKKFLGDEKVQGF